MSEFRRLLRGRLVQADWLEGIPEREVDALVEAARRRVVRKPAPVWRRDQQEDYLAVLLTGTLDVIRTTDGRPHVLRTLGPGATIGFSHVSGRRKRTHSVALVPTREAELALLPGSEIRSLLRRQPEVALRFVAHLGDLVAKLTEEKEELLRDDVLTRVARWIEANSRGPGEIRITQANLAAHVGATRPRVNEALKALEREGRIRCLRGAIRVLSFPSP